MKPRNKMVDSFQYQNYTFEDNIFRLKEQWEEHLSKPCGEISLGEAQLCSIGQIKTNKRLLLLS